MRKDRQKNAKEAVFNSEIRFGEQYIVGYIAKEENRAKGRVKPYSAETAASMGIVCKIDQPNGKAEGHKNAHR